MKFTHRTVGPRKAVGNAFIPNRIEPSRPSSPPPPVVHLLFNQPQTLKASLGEGAALVLKEWLDRV